MKIDVQLADGVLFWNSEEKCELKRVRDRCKQKQSNKQRNTHSRKLNIFIVLEILALDFE